LRSFVAIRLSSGPTMWPESAAPDRPAPDPAPIPPASASYFPRPA
jgi:hypothetical protein